MVLGIGEVLIGAGVTGMLAENPKGRAPRSCPECGVRLRDRIRRRAIYCPYCGEKLPRGGYCKECDREYRRGRYCPVHGTELTSEKEVEEKAKKEGEQPRFYQEMLKVVKAHPEGISLTQIGDQISQKWQGLIPAANQLIEEGKVRKEDKEYFPA